MITVAARNFDLKPGDLVKAYCALETFPKDTIFEILGSNFGKPILCCGGSCGQVAAWTPKYDLKGKMISSDRWVVPRDPLKKAQCGQQWIVLNAETVKVEGSW